MAAREPAGGCYHRRSGGATGGNERTGERRSLDDAARADQGRAILTERKGRSSFPPAGPVQRSVHTPLRKPAPGPAPPPFFVVLGSAQDGGIPQAGCRCERCRAAHADPALRRLPASAAVVARDAAGRRRRWLIDATPALPDQLRTLDGLAPPAANRAAPGLDGIFITHGHMGHFTGLMHLGREVMAADRVPVYAMPRMAALLRDSSPWRELLDQGHVALHGLQAERAIPLAPGIRVTPIPVPHRAERTETVGFLVEGKQTRVLHLPDIDDWPELGGSEAVDRPKSRSTAAMEGSAGGGIAEDRERKGEGSLAQRSGFASLGALLARCDIAYLDGSFFSEDELPGRDAREIPHPSIQRTLALCKNLAKGRSEDLASLRFTHFNHSNPAVEPDSEARSAIEAAGAGVAQEGECIPL